jgi:hypothetical protein
MSKLASWLARITWFWIIYWMRRPWMRRAHMAPLKWIQSESKRAKFIASYQSQNKLARRIGLPMLRFIYLIFLAVMALQVAYSFAMYLNESGYLTPSVLEDRRINRE